MADSATASEGEDDFAAIYGNGEVPQDYNPIADPTLPAPAVQPASYDPWEKFNRRVHRFNNAVDRRVAKPLATAYVKVTPRPVRLGVGNFFNNLGQPVSAVNALLQGKPKQAGQSMGRFLLNSTLGIGGIFDPASDAKLPRKSEDFGQTLGVWGWKRSRYVELPLFGPRTVRDVVGLVGDAPLAPLQQVDYDALRAQARDGLAQIEAGAPVNPIFQRLRDARADAGADRDRRLHELADEALARVHAAKRGKATKPAAPSSQVPTLWMWMALGPGGRPFAEMWISTPCGLSVSFALPTVAPWRSTISATSAQTALIPKMPSTASSSGKATRLRGAVFAGAGIMRTG
mgnify:CR=1 FL=1